MTKNYTVKISEFSIENYIGNYNISDIAKSKLHTTDILVLPTPYENDKYYFAQESIDFIKYSKAKNSEVDIDILAEDNEILVRSLHSFDIWMPIIWVGSNIVLPIALGLVISYIHERLKGRENENCTVKATFIINDGDNTKEIHYDGDAKTFKENFEKIDLNKMWEK